MARRRRSLFRLPRRRWPMRFLMLALLAVAGYFGKDRWSDIGLPGLDKPANNARGSARDITYPTAPSRQAYSDEQVLVERVVDGDTLVIAGGDRIRLIGVDTPETHHPTKAAQPFGQEAFAFTRRMTEGKQVVLRFDPGETKDRYGRTLAYVYVDGWFLNEALILQGLGRALTNYPFSSEMKARFRAAEAQAKAAKRGVWSLPKSPFDVSSEPGTKKAG
jgi:endonuclease YncB( thermonuclease family)